MAEETNQFELVRGCSDHYYYKNPKVGGNRSSNVDKMITKEWKILEENLPNSIFVRAYEERIDLLRAVIVGAPGTPYHDGLFFFDLAFPPNYPSAPPLVHYRSHGMRLNPNLYKCGTVCLSLLNTWNGSKNEKWIPSKSTILQVLVSIQGLVLNAEPYYNEPGWVRTPTSAPKSLNYNETAFTLSCKTMLLHLKNPPMNFEGFVSNHFRESAARILEACESYLHDFAVVGHYQAGGSKKKITRASGAVFKASMAQIIKDLTVAFDKNGIKQKQVCAVDVQSGCGQNNNGTAKAKQEKVVEPKGRKPASQRKRKLSTDEPQRKSKGSVEVKSNSSGGHQYSTRSKTGDIPKKSKRWEDEYLT